MHKRPQNFVQMISDLEANIHSWKVLEVLEVMDDEARIDYWVRVDFDMSLLVEMKEKNELLDNGDDGGNGDNGDDGDDGQ
ncbi:hypothetical protein LWI29_020037 [Acer saccharum]|uniref:Uncharacterized protein n=1 Tax=Acer saccharum TaxID=4024 RepID=A0AA39W8N8_ACESA|nr:hypothetical protein LWI29_020037 [Acer saccharum]